MVPRHCGRKVSSLTGETLDPRIRLSKTSYLETSSGTDRSVPTKTCAKRLESECMSVRCAMKLSLSEFRLRALFSKRVGTVFTDLPNDEITVWCCWLGHEKLSRSFSHNIMAWYASPLQLKWQQLTKIGCYDIREIYNSHEITNWSLPCAVLMFSFRSEHAHSQTPCFGRGNGRLPFALR